ncbi:hypothetical protein [Thermohalobacter berrensis]|uniref:Uncharacterized protein n=1 Tax=Thermohalobacter berrensis TaxID=99594 RepID=A0A419T8J1_9FIRM|nr:hypothetical protein [Thermohalobacter berrensis]RKD33864.1 hypothetical protein BET03_08005 [Thermohalobacter berrensis]
MKYIPKKLILGFHDLIKPRKICDYYKNDSKEIIGYGLGIFVTYKDISREKYIEKIIDSIKNLKLENVGTICLDKLQLLNYEDIKRIEKETNLKIVDGRKVNSSIINRVIEKICDINNIPLLKQELLIISDGTDMSRNLIIDISKKINYLSVMESNKDFLEKVEKEVLYSTGLSICSIQNLNLKSINKFKFIINLKNNVKLDIGKINKKTIIIDLSKGKELSKYIVERRKDLMVIDDFILKGNNKVTTQPLEFKLPKEVPSPLYQLIGDINESNLFKIVINNKSYTIKEASDIYLKEKSSMSNFYVKT